ncbi:S10 family serine carboxypeptidase-like protein [Sphingopyxis fribergensis]
MANFVTIELTNRLHCPEIIKSRFRPRHMLGRLRMIKSTNVRSGGLIIGLLAGALAATPALAAPAADRAPGAFTELPPRLIDDESVVVSEHRIDTPRGRLVYEARVGRIPIRADGTGQVRGRIFFTAYVVKTKGPSRPITFFWNGGPLVASAILHMEGVGPRRRTANGMVDSPDTLLADTDLVFMDAMETGFSRPAAPEFAADFMNLIGDVNTTAEFIRAFHARFRTGDQPLFIAGESYGVWRAAALVDQLTAAKTDVTGMILISGNVPGAPQPAEFYDAMHIPARTAASFHYKRLPPEMMQDRDATIKAAVEWARTVYMPALAHRDALTSEQRETIATDLARYIGMEADQVNRETLVVPVKQYLTTYLSPDGRKELTTEDLRLRVGDEGDDMGDSKLVDSYLRGELGYNTDLTYGGLETGYWPYPSPRKATISARWIYNQPGVTPAVLAEGRASGEVSPTERANPIWIQNALRQDPELQVFIANGRFDPLNMCEGSAFAVQTLAPELSRRIGVHCYESGHIIFRDDKARGPFLHDVSAFIQKTMAARRSGE